MYFIYYTEKQNLLNSSLHQIQDNFYSSSPVWNEKSFSIWFDGYIYLRGSGRILNEKDLFELYINHGKKICEKIKGIFVLMICDANTVQFFTDHLGIRKLFYSSQGKIHYFSNNFWELSGLLNIKTINTTGIALHALTNHFINGKTIVKEINFSKPATLIEIDSTGEIKIGNHWTLAQLLELPMNKLSIDDFSHFFLKNIENYLKPPPKRNATLTLTGGLDSRLILASMLKLGIKPNTFAYGNSSSRDVLIAKSVANRYALPFYNSPPSNISADWFVYQSKIIQEKGNSLAHFHRAYRWDGIRSALNQDEKKVFFAGYLGGEGIRGAHIDNLIISEFVQKWTHNKSPELIKKHLFQNFVNPNKTDIEEIIQELSELPYFTRNLKHNEFYLLFHLNASNHLAQDINYYIDSGIELVLPYMDIDYLTLLFSSRFSMLNKNNTSKNQFKRLNIPDFHCKMIASIYPDLTNFILTNGYKPSEYLMGKIPYVIARGVRGLRSKPIARNFSYNNWFFQYLKQSGSNFTSDHGFFDNKQFFRDLSDEKSTSETGLHKYTSVVMLNSFIDKIF